MFVEESELKENMGDAQTVGGKDFKKILEEKRARSPTPPQSEGSRRAARNEAFQASPKAM